MVELFQLPSSLIKKFAPQRPSGPTVGLDIGIDSCKAVELKKSGNSYELLNWLVEPIENNDVAGAVKRIVGKMKSQPKSVVTAVFGKGTLIRYIDMPVMPLDALKRSFLLEADKYFPFPQDQIYMDCYILSTNPATKKMSTLVAVAKKEIIEERIKLLTGLDLETNLITVNSIAVANCLHVLGTGPAPVPSPAEPKDAAASVVAILDMGDVVSHLMILQDNLPCFNRDIFIGGRHFTQAISHGLGISLQEAQRLKYQPQERLTEIFTACESTLMHLVSELRLSCDYFITERNIHIGRLLLSGGASQLEGLQAYLVKNLEMKIEPWDPLPSLKIAPDVPLPELKKNVYRLGVALGLALYQ